MDELKSLLFLTLVFGGVPAFAAYATLAVGWIGAPFAYPWRDAIARRRTALVLAFAVPPLAAFLWGRVFETGAGRYPVGNPVWLSGFLEADVLAAAILAAWLATTLRGARLFAVLMGAACIALTFLLSFEASIRISTQYL
jgi:hypothetical protein